MIHEKELRLLVRRLRTLPTGADDCPWEDAAEELFRTLWRIADDDENAERIVDACMVRAWRPTPAELRSVAEALPQTEPAGVHGPVANCGYCNGTGWRRIERGGMSGVELCECDTRRVWAMNKQHDADQRETKRNAELRAKRQPAGSPEGDRLAAARRMR